MRSDLIDVTVELITDTDRAILVTDGGHPVWLPKSQIEYERRGVGGLYEVTLPVWLAHEKGLV